MINKNIPVRLGSTILMVFSCLSVSEIASAATILYDNLSNNSGTPYYISSTAPMGDSFSTGANSFALTDLNVRLELTDAATGSTIFSLWSDNSLSPGTQITILGSINDTSLSGTPTNYAFSGLNVSLSASSRYWVMATATGNAKWDSTGDANGIGTVNEYFVWGGSVYPNTSGPWNMSVSGIESGTSVPEPASLMLIIGGLGALSMSRRKAR